MNEEEKNDAPKKRGRPRKVEDVNPVINEESPLNRLLMEDTDLQNRFNAMAAQGSMFFPMDTLQSYNPFLQNTRLKQIATTPVEGSKEDLIRYLREPQFHERELRGASWALSSTQYIYYKILRESADIPLFKYTKLPELLPVSEYQTEKFKSDDTFTDDWLAEFDVVNTFKRVALEVKREGKSSYLVRSSVSRKNGKKVVNYATLQKLPTEYTKLTAIGPRGYIASFNLLIFLNPAYSPLQYPPFIQAIWADMHDQGVIVEDNKNKLTFDVNAAATYSFDYEGNNYKGIIEKNKTRTYCYWVELPQDLCYTFSSDTSHAWVAPDTAGLFLNLQELSDYSTLAGLIASTPLTSILTGEMEPVANPSAGRDQTIVSPETVSRLMALFNEMTSTNTEAFFAPLKNLKLQSITNVPNSSEIQSTATSNFINLAGEGGNIIATSKPTVAQVKTANMLAAAQAQFVTEQFRSALNHILNYNIGAEYKWKIDLFGDVFNESAEKKYLKELVLGGSTAFLPKLLAYENMTVRDGKAVIDYLHAIGFYKNDPKTLQEKAEAQASSGQVGRPALDDSEIESEETAKSRDTGDNVSDVKDIYTHNKCALCGEEVTDDILCDSCRAEYIAQHLDEEEYSL